MSELNLAAVKGLVPDHIARRFFVHPGPSELSDAHICKTFCGHRTQSNMMIVGKEANHAVSEIRARYETPAELFTRFKQVTLFTHVLKTVNIVLKTGCLYNPRTS
jgi:hypothetical protein